MFVVADAADLAKKQKENNMDIQKGAPVETLLFACSGGSNVGQIANDVCRELTKDGTGKLYCLAGMAGTYKNF